MAAIFLDVKAAQEILDSDVKGIFLYLYMVMDIYSRKIVGWQAHANESSALASDLMVDICKRENIKRNQVVLISHR